MTDGRTITLAAERGPYVIWTDGACDPNPGPGGWGFVMRRLSGAVTEACGGELATTSNRTELTAVLEALRILPDGAQAIVYSDSTYVVNGLTIWRPKWARRDWRKVDGKPMPNRDLWLELDRQVSRLRAAFVWVRGHAGDPGNERADRLAAQGLANILARRAMTKPIAIGRHAVSGHSLVPGAAA